MATLTSVQSSANGTAVTYVAASAGGDKFGAGANRHFRVKNASGGALTVTIAVPGTTKYGQAMPAIGPVSVAAAAEFVFGPFPPDLANPADSLIAVTYPGGVTSLSVAVVDV